MQTTTTTTTAVVFSENGLFYSAHIRPVCSVKSSSGVSGLVFFSPSFCLAASHSTQRSPSANLPPCLRGASTVHHHYPAPSVEVIPLSA